MNQDETQQISPFEHYLNEQAQKADAFLERVKEATSACDLRLAWEIYPEEFVSGDDEHSFLLFHLSIEKYSQLGHALTTELQRLGLDLDSDDERIKFMLGIIEEPEIEESSEMVRMNTFFDNFGRLVGAIDTSKSETFELLPFETITFINYPQLVQEDLRKFCQGREVFSYHPTKYRREVFALEKPYHGYVVGFDDFPESFSGSGPNVSLHIPTARLRLEDLYKVDPSIRTVQWVNKRPYFVPTTIMAQSLQLGGNHIGVNLFTTPTIEEFIADVHEHVLKISE